MGERSFGADLYFRQADICAVLGILHIAYSPKYAATLRFFFWHHHPCSPLDPEERIPPAVGLANWLLLVQHF